MLELKDKDIGENINIRGHSFIFFIGGMSISDSIAFFEIIKTYKDISTIYLAEEMKDERLFRYMKLNLETDVIFFQQRSYDSISSMLTKQPIGTKLFLIGEWEMIEDLKQLAIEAGFTEEEMVVKGIGMKEEKVFCAKCYHLNKKTDQNVVKCDNCNTKLDVSKHYSKRHKAYLGYISM
ncbi:dimethylamine monooxygenase subunit DmmA family protein [Neobacillus sp. LXY-4]|uniref:dimethylamine monooxygenase subunit DmmA family protein n=1 Tax=Neobacillus sp. LXY-4 TaxID=3379826 RepID=UPI003EE2CA93